MPWKTSSTMAMAHESRASAMRVQNWPKAGSVGSWPMARPTNSELSHSREPSVPRPCGPFMASAGLCGTCGSGTHRETCNSAKLWTLEMSNFRWQSDWVLFAPFYHHRCDCMISWVLTPLKTLAFHQVPGFAGACTCWGPSQAAGLRQGISG